MRIKTNDSVTVQSSRVWIMRDGGVHGHDYSWTDDIFSWEQMVINNNKHETI